MSNKQRLAELVELLSETECTYLLRAVTDAVDGERFWEDDFGLLYNEFAKLRLHKLGRYPPPEHESSFIPIPIVKSYRDAPRTELGEPLPVRAPIDHVLRVRRSRREYEAAPISKAQLSSLLACACGTTGSIAAYGLTNLALRSFPSHGGLQGPEVYIAIRVADGVPHGLYHYSASDHVLELLSEGDRSRQLREAAFGEDFVARAAAVFIITGHYDRLRWKYGDRTYRFLCMDTGFLGANLYMVAEGLGLGICAVSGFAQDAVESLLGVDGKQEMALLLLTVGVRSDMMITDRRQSDS